MAKFDVTVVKIGNVSIDADSAEDAASLVEEMPDKQITWGETSVTDVREEEG